MKLSVGHIVHYVDGNSGTHLAAIIVGVNDASPTAVNLTVFGHMPGQTQGWHSVAQDEEGKAGGTWHFPERVD